MATKYRRQFTHHGELAGVCGVDSGQIMFTDPCYVKDFRDEMSEGGEFDCNVAPSAGGDYPYTYNGACTATTQKFPAGQLGPCQGVVTSTGYGDGLYPVYVKTNDEGRVVSATIVFIEDEDNDNGW